MLPKNIIPANQILPITDYEDSRTGWRPPNSVEMATSIRRARQACEDAVDGPIKAVPEKHQARD